MDTRIRLGIIGAAAAAVLSIALGVPGNAGAQTQPAPQQGPAEQAQPVTVNVDLDEWDVLPSVRSVAAGVPVRVVARNVGSISHQLQLTATGLPNVQSAVLAPGESYTIDLVFGAAFNAQLLCPIGNAER